MEYDAIVIGAGPAGLTAAVELACATHRVLVLEAESFGGAILNVEWIQDYPRPGEKMAGAMLASELVDRAQAAGVEMQVAQVSEVEFYSGCISVTRADGAAHTSSVLVLAAGLRSRSLGVPGEARLQGKGMIHCAMCDAGLYRDRVVAVCGAGDAGVIEALYLARFCSKVHLLEKSAAPSAKASLLQEVMKEPKIELRCGVKPVEVVGDDSVTGIVIEQADGRREELDVYGVLVHVGYEPATNYLHGALSLDASNRVIVNESLETGVPGVFAVGDLRSGSPRGVVAAIADGKAAARAAREFLRA
ncbi:MAG: FAD-dependent oxidoreductase [Burkholderiaceae bacterium]|nr:FAD-dependent oxidoreductase [Burkholderiaceae bacterium]